MVLSANGAATNARRVIAKRFPDAACSDPVEAGAHAFSLLRDLTGLLRRPHATVTHTDAD
ncbi:hypothetical protein E4N62_38610 [Streptomyces sp. MNU76]|uniref:hypothetical protein n=1 Tax=Streptomyces sp. MNU76 TaxID=2560026 RepID=UPI001E430707|nr:hypothetical protein [Streptomyces sp. MNU76]MCC9710638.1 hypothetical protein [Streptomyces sp. MNU76]